MINLFGDSTPKEQTEEPSAISNDRQHTIRQDFRKPLIDREMYNQHQLIQHHANASICLLPDRCHTILTGA
jgi:hypothetical protein